MKHFANCHTIEELKQEYKRLVKLHHPDNGGNENTMKAINNEYDLLFDKLKNIHNAKSENADNQNTEQPEEFRAIINELMKLNGIIIEICGSWIWVSGETYIHKAKLKEMGLKWASKKQQWYWGELKGKKSKGLSMDTIRNKYGSETYKTAPVFKLA